jgi:hypothetical protein
MKPPKEPPGPPPPGFRSVSPSSAVFGSGSATTFTGGVAPYTLTLRVATSGGEMTWSDPITFEGVERADSPSSSAERMFDAPETSAFAYLRNLAEQGWDGVFAAFSSPANGGEPGPWFTGAFGKDHPLWGPNVLVVVDAPGASFYPVS